MQDLLSNVGMDVSGPFIIFEDNSAALIISLSGRRKPRNKHMDIRYFWIHEKVNSKQLDIQKKSTKDMLADIFTKAVIPVDQFRYLRTQIGVVEI